ncbi:MAG: restriction endonuclease subunit S [Candidatus Cloacimonetes bacterium]|nr:restriction endonuclease subunit S [Candidatus Cloacimonadota bacterium]
MQRNKNRKGYKKTKVGWIPAEWKEKTLGSFTKWGSGGTPSKANELYWGGNIPWISAISMHTTRFSDSILKITKEGLKSGSRLAPKNSLLLLVRGSMLFKKIPVGITEIDVAFNQDVKSIIPNEKYASPEYLLAWLLGHEHKLLGMVGGTGIGAGKLDSDGLLALVLPLPPLPEQTAIAGVLECWDKAIKNLDLKIAKKRQVKKGLQQRLLSGKLRLTGEKNSECRIGNRECEENGELRIGNSELGIPAGWKSVLLGDVCVISYGKDWKTVASENGEFYVYGTGGIMGKACKYLFDAPAILIGRKGTINKPIFIIEKFWAVDTAFAVHANRQSEAQFLYYAFQQIQWLNYSEASGVPSLSRPTIEKIKLVIPPLPEQKAIARVLSAADSEIEALETKLRLWKEQKKYLLNNLVTGTIRLPEFRNITGVK